MTPQALLAALRDASARRDEAALVALANAHAAEILEHFGRWLTVPEEIRADAAAVQAWAEPLVLLAQMFEASGYPQLMQRLQGGVGDVLQRWESELARAERYVAAGHYAQVSPLVEPLLPELERAGGPAVDALRARACALLARVQVEQGEHAGGEAWMQRALAAAVAAEDYASIRRYRSDLRVMRVIAAAGREDGEGQDLLRLRAAIAAAQALSDAARFAESNATLGALQAQADYAALLPEFAGKIHGLLGLNCARLGDYAAAREHTAQALEHCRRDADLDGVRIYEANLQHIEARLQC
jgi:hypothetical protein